MSKGIITRSKGGGKYTFLLHLSKILGSGSFGVTPSCAPTSTHMHVVTGGTPDPMVAPAPREGAMQCEVSSRHRSPPRGPGREQRAGPVPVPSRPRGGDTCCHTGWLACPGCGRTLQCTQIIQLMRTQPSNEDRGVSSLGVTTLGGFYQNPPAKSEKRGRSEPPAMLGCTGLSGVTPVCTGMMLRPGQTQPTSSSSSSSSSSLLARHQAGACTRRRLL